VNLSDPGRPRFLKLVVHLELDSEAVSTELQTLKPKVRDAMLTLLSSKTSAELSTVADKERLRNEMIHRLNAFLTAGKVVEVYFIEFVVQ
jgi:flagellar FliL protein